MKAVARVTQENGLWWAAYQCNGLMVRLPFRSQGAALYWLDKHGYAINYGNVARFHQKEFHRRQGAS